MSTVFAKDAVFVTSKGPLHGQEEIQNYFADLFKNVKGRQPLGFRGF
jgi:ketosteroid isomerase-like protein